MENLRWILLVAGLGIVLGIYLFSLYQSRKDDLPRRRKPRREAPIVEDVDDIGEFDYDDELEDVVNQVGELYAGDEPEFDPLFDEMPQGDALEVRYERLVEAPLADEAPGTDRVREDLDVHRCSAGGPEGMF